MSNCPECGQRERSEYELVELIDMLAKIVNRATTRKKHPHGAETMEVTVPLLKLAQGMLNKYRGQGDWTGANVEEQVKHATDRDF